MRTSAAQTGDWFKIVNKDTPKGEPTVTEVYIYDEIGYWGTNAQDFVKELMSITSDVIELHLNSPGGAVFDGVAIYNALKMHTADVNVYVDALAASAASFIAQAGDQVIMTRNATMMIHDASALCYGNSKDMQATADLLDKVSNNVADMYVQSAGGTIEEWRALMREEVWYNAEEALAAGLATSILDTANTDAEKAKNNWNLTIFNHAGRENAPAPEQVRSKVLNRLSKENTVGNTAPKNNNGPGGETAPASTPPNEGQATGTEGTPAEEETNPPAGSEGTGEAGASGDGAPVPGTEPTQRTVVLPEAKGGVQGFLINGVVVTDQAAVQRHIVALETVQKENKEQGRKDFVAKLASDHKISAGQIASLEQHALSLTDEQWPGFAASWDAAPTQSLLAKHGEGTQNHGNTGEVTDKVADEITTLEDIVAHHKRAGKSEEEIKNMTSYKRLQALKSTNQS